MDDSSKSRLDEEKVVEESQCDRDVERLRKLGYDAVLGRPLGFWGNMFLSLTCMNPMFDIVVSTTVWAWDGPALFVSGPRSCSVSSATQSNVRSG